MAKELEENAVMRTVLCTADLNQTPALLLVGVGIGGFEFLAHKHRASLPRLSAGAAYSGKADGLISVAQRAVVLCSKFPLLPIRQAFSSLHIRRNKLHN